MHGRHTPQEARGGGEGHSPRGREAPPSCVPSRGYGFLHHSPLCPCFFLPPPHYSPLDADEALGELQKFLFLLATNSEEELSPGPVIDKLWHTLLLFPALYADVCELLPGGELLDHDPTKERDEEEEKEERYARTLELYEERWGPPSSRFWPAVGAGEDAGAEGGGGCAGAPDIDVAAEEAKMAALRGGGGSIQLFVKTLTGKTVTLDAHPSFTALHLKLLVQVRKGA